MTRLMAFSDLAVIFGGQMLKEANKKAQNAMDCLTEVKLASSENGTSEPDPLGIEKDLDMAAKATIKAVEAIAEAIDRVAELKNTVAKSKLTTPPIEDVDDDDMPALAGEVENVDGKSVSVEEAEDVVPSGMEESELRRLFIKSYIV
ncbi:hypothetical protein Hte_006901 [Hypoxylon texense]